MSGEEEEDDESLIGVRWESESGFKIFFFFLGGGRQITNQRPFTVIFVTFWWAVI